MDKIQEALEVLKELLADRFSSRQDLYRTQDNLFKAWEDYCAKA